MLAQLNYMLFKLNFFLLILKKNNKFLFQETAKNNRTMKHDSLIPNQLHFMFL